MEKIAVIYWSGTGNTASMAEEIARGIKEVTAEVEIFSVEQFKKSISDYDKIAFGCSAMGDEVLEEGDFEPFYESVEDSLSGKKIALFGSYGWGDGKWMRDWVERAEGKSAKIYGEGFIINGEPDTSGKEQCYQFGKEFASF